MKRLALSITLAAILASTISLTACSPGAKRYEATFDKYEATTEVTTDTAGVPSYELHKTGNAFVVLEDGTRVRADCPIQDVAQGKRVTAQQNADGSWAVIEVLPAD